MILDVNDVFKLKSEKAGYAYLSFCLEKKGEGNQCVISYLFVRESDNISGLNSSVARLLVQYARGPGVEFQLRLNFSPPVTNASVQMEFKV